MGDRGLSRSIDYEAGQPTSSLIERTKLVAYMAAAAAFLAWSANALELSPGELFRSPARSHPHSEMRERAGNFRSPQGPGKNRERDGEKDCSEQ